MSLAEAGRHHLPRKIVQLRTRTDGGGRALDFVPLPLFTARRIGGRRARGQEVERRRCGARARLRARLAAESRIPAGPGSWRSRAAVSQAERAQHSTGGVGDGGAYPQVLIAQRTLAQVRAEYLDALDDVWRHVVLLEGSLLEGGLADPAEPSSHEAMESEG